MRDWLRTRVGNFERFTDRGDLPVLRGEVEGQRLAR
jgi:hypothetical protein